MMPLSLMLRATSPDHSPCIGICDHEAANGECRGCSRQRKQVAGWKQQDGETLADAWQQVARRLDDRGCALMRLPLNTADMLELAAERLTTGGSWLAGGNGHWASASRLLEASPQMVSAGRPARWYAEEGTSLAARDDASGAEITLRLEGKIRALAWAHPAAGQRCLSTALDSLPVVLAMPKKAAGAAAKAQLSPRPEGGFRITGCLAETVFPAAGFSPLGPAERELPADLPLPENYAFGVLLLPAGFVLQGRTGPG